MAIQRFIFAKTDIIEEIIKIVAGMSLKIV